MNDEPVLTVVSESYTFVPLFYSLLLPFKLTELGYVANCFTDLQVVNNWPTSMRYNFSFACDLSGRIQLFF